MIGVQRLPGAARRGSDGRGTRTDGRPRQTFSPGMPSSNPPRLSSPS